jgi:hypothetical protein
MALTSEEKQELHNLGQKDEAEGKIIFAGPPLRVFESTAEYEERKEVYDKGRGW